MAAGGGGEFVDGWLVAQVLGEGAYGEVRLLVHGASGACVAVKAVRGGAGAREAALHRALRHAHVLRCLGARAQPPTHYLFLEYAQGGELFDRIEPDRGMPAAAARGYCRQLLAGIAYLHSRGVAHRDIKPENLLLDHRDRLKISDFGMATLFRHGTRERLLDRVCGTVPYAAPEVHAAAARPYRAPPADLWAAAVVLLAMLAGELPWERASPEDTRYAAWCASYEGEWTVRGLWRRLPAAARALLRAALRPAPADRAPLRPDHPWLLEEDAPQHDGDTARGWCSQPARDVTAARDVTDGADELCARDMDALMSHSQPAHTDDLLLASQHDPNTQGAACVVARVVRRMTRLWLRCGEEEALQTLQQVLDEKHYSWRRVDKRTLALECGGVRMRAWSWRCGGCNVLEFRRARGCGLAFKRRFLELRDAPALAALASPQAPPPLADLLAPLRAHSQPMDHS